MTASNATMYRKTALASLGLLGGLAMLGAVDNASSAETAGNLVTNDYATLRLSASEPGQDGSIRGALTIDLEPGWKTYWLDPGPSGIPPQIDFSGTRGAAETAIFAPLPDRFGEELARANGYKHDLALAFTIAPEPGEVITGPVTAKIFLGVCEEICIPVQATLTATPESETGLVETAFEALPAEMEKSAVDTRIDGESLVIAVTKARESDDRTGLSDLTDAFVLGPNGWYFGEPKAPERQGDVTTFRVPIDERPNAATAPKLTIVFADHKKGLTTVSEPKP